MGDAPKSLTPAAAGSETAAGVELLWPVGEPASERVGTEPPLGWYIALEFDQEYWLGCHTGLDISIPGEGDFGAACYAVADGVVRHAGRLPGTWGMVILLEHAGVAGHRRLWSQYAHLSRIQVGAGEAVRQGQRIGAVGNAEGRLGTHLHFELRRENLAAGHWPSGAGRSKTAAVHAFIRRAYVDPLGLLGK